MAHAAVVVGGGLLTLSVGITARRSRPKVWTDPRLVSVVLAPPAPIAEMVRNRDLVTSADLQRPRANAAIAETKSCNAKMESVDDFGSVNFP